MRSVRTAGCRPAAAAAASLRLVTALEAATSGAIAWQLQVEPRPRRAWAGSE